MAERLLRKHGGYRELLAFQLAEIVYDGTVLFCEKHVSMRSRTREQMIQAGRSGKQNIAEGNQMAATSATLELNLANVARASLEELKLDYEDFLRHRRLSQWDKNSVKAKYIREIAGKPGRSLESYRRYVCEKSPETAANTLLCLVNQTSFLLDRLIAQMERQLENEGGFSEKVRAVRTQKRKAERQRKKVGSGES